METAVFSGMFGAIQSWDASVLLFIQEHLRIPSMNPFWLFITHLGDHGLFWLILSVLLLFWKRTRIIGGLALCSIALGFLVTNVFLKEYVARIRPYETVPDLILMIEKQKDFSFPSGHACTAFCAAAIYVRMMKKLWGLLSMLLAVLIAVSRLYVGVHYPSDVIVGTLIGLFAGFLVFMIYQKLERRKKHR